MLTDGGLVQSIPINFIYIVAIAIKIVLHGVDKTPKVF